MTIKKSHRLILACISNIIELCLILVLALFILPRLGIDIPLYGLVAIIAAWIGFSVWIFRTGTRALAPGPLAGLPDMAGLKGVAIKDLEPEGTIKIKGEIWHARAETPVKAGQEVVVVSDEGMTLIVRPFEQA